MAFHPPNVHNLHGLVAFHSSPHPISFAGKQQYLLVFIYGKKVVDTKVYMKGIQVMYQMFASARANITRGAKEDTTVLSCCKITEVTQAVLWEQKEFIPWSGAMNTPSLCQLARPKYQWSPSWVITLGARQEWSHKRNGLSLEGCSWCWCTWYQGWMLA